MTLETNLSLVFWNTIGQIMTQAPTFILIVWSIKTITKQMPKWITTFFTEMQKQKVMDMALQRRLQ